MDVQAARAVGPTKAGAATAGPIVLVVDDEEVIRSALRHRLEQNGYVVIEAGSGAEARAEFDEPLDLVLLDYKLGDTDGFTLLDELKARAPEVPVILLTAFSTIERAVEAIHRGAYHFITKPFEANEVVGLVEKALETTRLRREVSRLRAAQGVGHGVSSIVGESETMRDVKRMLTRFARARMSTVLLTGESGTGKDLAARAIHAASDRAQGPFMNITCSALPGQLLESELFGHERGAFTDAKQQKKGLLEQATTGTVFLDEIAEMAPSLQAKVLRFLEEHTFRRVGGSTEINPDVRVIAATNRNLAEMVQAGTFREDLYYRLSVLHVHLPPLRERGHDVSLIAKLLVESFSREFGKGISVIEPSVLTLLETYHWPGNIRELRNAIERATLLCEGDALRPPDFDWLFRQDAATTASHDIVLPPGGLDFAELEKDLVRQALERTHGNQTRAARLLGMNRDQIRYRIEKFKLS